MHRQTLQHQADRNIVLSRWPNTTCPALRSAMGGSDARDTGVIRGWDIESIQAVQDRLELLLSLEVPCEVKVAIPSGYAQAGREIRRTERKRGYFSLIGECFSFHMNEHCLEATYVATGQPLGGTPNALELRGSDGRLCARIVCPLDRMAAAWCDVWDSLIYAGRGEAREKSRGALK